MAFSIHLQQIKTLATSMDLVPANETSSIEVVEIDAQSLTIQAPSATIAPGVLVSFGLTLEIDGETLAFSATGKVLSSTKVPENQASRTKIHLSQYNQDFWAKLLSAAEKDQSRVDRILSAMTGGES